MAEQNLKGGGTLARFEEVFIKITRGANGSRRIASISIAISSTHFAKFYKNNL